MSKVDFLVKGIVNPIKNIICIVRYYKENMTSFDLRGEMARNGLLDGLYDNQRCFIIGNGPSIKKQDLKKIRNEIIFTVNDIVKSSVFKDIKSNYHVYADPAYFNGEFKDVFNDSLRHMKEYDESIKIFVPYRFKKDIDKEVIDLIDYYCYDCMNFTLYKRSKGELIDLRRPIFVCQTVIQMAIYIAIYMGFKQIYLIGCDMTGFLEFYISKRIGNDDQYGHVYYRDDEMRERLQKIINIHDNEFYLKNYAKMFEIYKEIRAMCSGRDIKIINITDGGALDVFERECYEEIIGK